MLNLDGEYGGDTPVELEVFHNHLEFFANIDEISDDALCSEKSLMNLGEIKMSDYQVLVLTITPHDDYLSVQYMAVAGKPNRKGSFIF